MDQLLVIPAMVVMLGGAPAPAKMSQLEYHPIKPKAEAQMKESAKIAKAEKDRTNCNLNSHSAGQLVAYANYNQHIDIARP